MAFPIETAPKHEGLIILVDESAGAYQVARWSVMDGHWVGEEGEPLHIKPTSWVSSVKSSRTTLKEVRRRKAGRRRRTIYGLCAGVPVVLIILASSFRGLSSFVGNVTNILSPSAGNIDINSEMFVKTSALPVSLDPASQNSPHSTNVQSIVRDVVPPEATAAGREQVIEQEPQNADVTRQDGATASAEIEAARVRTAAESAALIQTQQVEQAAAGQEPKRDHEFQRGSPRTRDLASAGQEVETRTAVTSSAGNALNKAHASASEQNDALDHERQPGEVLALQLAPAREEIETLIAPEATMDVRRIETPQPSQAAEASTAEQKEAIEQERQRAKVLAQQLASAREEIETWIAPDAMMHVGPIETPQTSQAAEASISEQKEAIEQERQRAKVLAQQLASAREEIETLIAPDTMMHVGRIETPQTSQATEASTPEQTQALEQQRHRARAFEDDMSDSSSGTNLARSVAPMIFVRSGEPVPQPDPAPETGSDAAHVAPVIVPPTDPAQHARPEASRASNDMFAEAPTERTTAMPDLAEESPRASKPSTAKRARAQDKAARQFLKDAIQSSLAEVEMGKLAQEKAQSDEVKSFGRVLENDHGDANQKVVSVAAQMGVQPPSEPSKKQKAEYSKMSKLSGDKFDQAFTRHLVADHKKDIRAFKKQAKRNDAAGQLAQETLPTLRKHLEMAQSLSKGGAKAGALRPSDSLD